MLHLDSERPSEEVSEVLRDLQSQIAGLPVSNNAFGSTLEIN